MKTHIKRILPWTMAVLMVLALCGCIRIQVPAAPSKAPPSPEISPTSVDLPTDESPSPAPGISMKVAFKAQTMNGDLVTEEFFTRHKVTFVNYWATWCGPCTGELPDLQKLYEKYGNDVGFLGVALDNPMDTAAVQGVLDTKGVKYTNVAVTPELEAMTDLSAIPATILVLSDGSIYGEPIIGSVGPEKYSERIEEALANAK